MTKDYFSEGVLVYDRYYCSKPATPLLIIKRILLTAVFCGCSMGVIVTGLGFSVSVPAFAGITAAMCAALCTLFTFVKKRIAIPAIIAAAGVVLWLRWESAFEKLTYFADACMLSVEGRFLYPRRFLFHRSETLDSANVPYVEGVVLGTLLLCLLYSLVVSACFSGRLVPVPAVLMFVALCVPPLLSEKLEFSLWLIPALASLAGLIAIRRNYSGGLAVKHSSTSDYRRRLRHEERTFMRRISSAPYLKRIEMKGNYYSKYFSVGMYCASLAAVCLLAGAAIFPNGSSIDYTGVYEFLTSFSADNSISDSPFEDGAASEYFTHGGESKHDILNIITPGRGEREIIRVDYTGDRPFYLRGDIGIDFNGTSWTTAVSNEPDLWRSSGLSEYYRPCENRVIAALLSATGNEISSSSGGGDVQIITTSDVTIDYLCDTSVVFLPPYTAEFSFYNNDSFDVFADYAVRVSDSAGGHVNSVRCTALIPSYISNETSWLGYLGLSQVIEAFSQAGCTLNDIYSSVIPEMTESDVISEYEDYVESTYLSIPEEYRSDISDYIQRHLRYLTGQIEDRELSTAEIRYLAASEVENYLRDHYTYSLDGSNNSRNPVMQFLEDTKRGHCSLYASAMTLILREMGIPARYCTGFYVESVDGGNSVLLREKNLHAWVEVYLGEYGWATFDPTSSSAYPGRTSAPDEPSGESDSSVAPRPTYEDPGAPDRQSLEIVKSSEEQASSAGTSDIITETAEPASPLAGLLPLIPAFLAAAAVVLVGVVLLNRYSSLKKRARSTLDFLKTGEPTMCAAQIYRLILELMETQRFTPGRGEFPAELFARADKVFGTDMTSLTGLIEKMEFGGHDISGEERGLLYAQLEVLLEKIRPFNLLSGLNTLRLICKCTKK